MISNNMLENETPKSQISVYKMKDISDSKKEELRKVMTDEEVEQYTKLVKRFEYAKMQRSMIREEFDDKSYELDYVHNKRVALTYLNRKRNDDEVRVNTGTTEKKLDLS